MIPESGLVFGLVTSLALLLSLMAIWEFSLTTWFKSDQDLTLRVFQFQLAFQLFLIGISIFYYVRYGSYFPSQPTIEPEKNVAVKQASTGSVNGSNPPARSDAGQNDGQPATSDVDKPTTEPKANIRPPEGHDKPSWVTRVVFYLEGLIWSMVFAGALTCLFNWRFKAWTSKVDKNLLPTSDVYAILVGIKKQLLSRSEMAEEAELKAYYHSVDSLEKLWNADSKEDLQFHLCLSTDDRLSTKLFSPEAAMILLFAEHQRVECVKAVKKGAVKADNCVVCKYDGAEAKALNDLINKSIEKCKATLITNHAQFATGGGTDSPVSNSRAPLAIRVLFSDPAELVHTGCGFRSNGLLFPGIKNSEVWNLWIPWKLVATMDVKKWCDCDSSRQSVCRGFDNCVLHVKNVIDMFRTKYAVHGETATDWSAKYHEYAKNPGGRVRSGLQFLHIGHVSAVAGYDEGIVEAKENAAMLRSAWLHALPVVLMALHCGKVLSFDDIGVTISEDLRGDETSEAKVAAMVKRIDKFLEADY